MITAVAKVGSILKPQATRASNVYKKTSSTVKTWVVTAFGAIAVFFVGRYFLRQYKKKQEQKKLAYSAESQQAALIRASLNPSGTSWLMWGDGTKEGKLMSVASQITDINAVTQAYRNLYNSEMHSDIQNELSSYEYTQFLNTINQKKGYRNNELGEENTSKAMLVVTTSNEVNYYASKASFNMPFKAIRVLKNSQYPVGVTTGKQYKLSLFGSNLTKTWTAIEVNVKTTEGSFRKVYVDANNVELKEKTKDNIHKYQARWFNNADFD